MLSREPEAMSQIGLAVVSSTAAEVQRVEHAILVEELEKKQAGGGRTRPPLPSGEDCCCSGLQRSVAPWAAIITSGVNSAAV